MQRRTALKLIALGSMTPPMDALGAASDCPMPEGTAWTPADYQLQFLTPAENELLDQLTEMIIPADAHSPGARAARVSLFADLMVATSNEKAKAQWRDGLRLFQETAAKSSLADALAQAAAHEGHPTTELERFFAVLKPMTVNGYYTSEIGIHQDLEYIGNTYLASFPGCDSQE
ncbi:MAG TPA: gluconate 2-dehydrogenase subunit 3 family protein [Terriglobia bacterium]|nr:gluconate 2-dehydrogenase subunit 3 family protein [Terriglobia bacterium]